jgi:hypothetical protein
MIKALRTMSMVLPKRQEVTYKINDDKGKRNLHKESF